MDALNNIFLDFQKDAKIWIFQSDRELHSSEVEELSTLGLDFANDWKAHGSDLKASATILYDRFYIFISDESVNMAGGCSIDKLVHFVKEVGQKHGINFFNRLSISYILDGNIVVSTLSDMKHLIETGQISQDTIVFNNAVTSLSALKSSWKVSVGQSFLKKFIKSESIV